MIRHAYSGYPQECCGLLAGLGERIDEIIRCRNQQRSPCEFSIPPRQLLNSFKSIRNRRKEFLGIYHSHPADEAYPSAQDSAQFWYPGVSYWIVSLQTTQPVVRCFCWQEKGFVATEILCCI
jgi:proteasome lid subunit RPN8/RPN11